MELEPSEAHLPSGTIAILGGGVAGSSAAAWLRGAGREVVVFDRDPHRGIEPGRGDWEGVSAVVSSPGIPPAHPWREEAAARGLPLFGEADLAVAAWTGPVVLVTGTNGKTSVCHLLETALREAGEPVVALGNLGTPASAARKATSSTWMVHETSSFQAYDWRLARADRVIWTNFADDHLDWHPDRRAYFSAKRCLLGSLKPGGLAYVGPSVPVAAEAFGFSLPAEVRLVGEEETPGPSGTVLAEPPQAANHSLVARLFRDAGLPAKALEAAAVAFRPDPARREPLGRHLGLQIINDSKATNPHAAVAGLRGLSRPVFWIGGGRDKGLPLGPFAGSVAPLVDHAFLIGETGPALAQSLREWGVDALDCGDLATAVRAAFARASGKGTLVLSPGFASFDQFSGYLERGHRFREQVFSLTPSAVHG